MYLLVAEQELHLYFQDRTPQHVEVHVYHSNFKVDDPVPKSGLYVPHLQKHMPHSQALELATVIRNSLDYTRTPQRCHLCHEPLDSTSLESVDHTPCYWEDKEVHAQCCRKKKGVLLPIQDLKTLLLTDEYQSLHSHRWFVLQNVRSCPRILLKVESERFQYIYICGDSFDFLDKGKVRTQCHFMEWLETALDSQPVSLQWYTHAGDTEVTDWHTRTSLSSKRKKTGCKDDTSCKKQKC